MFKFIKLVPVLLIVFLAYLMTGCGRETIKGVGNSKQERREVKTFSGIDVDGDYLISGTLGTPQQLTISSNANVLPYIKSSVENDILTIKDDTSVDLQATVQQNLWFTTEKFQILRLNGNTQFEMYNLNSNQLDCALKGTHVVFLKGKLAKLKIVINGNANVNAKDLEVSDADIEINGSAVIGVNVTANLNVKINGDGKVIYYGGHPKVVQSISGFGEIGSAFGALGEQEQVSSPKESSPP